MLDSSSALRASDLKSPSMDMLDFRKVKDWTGAGKISEYGDSDREIRRYRNQYKEFVGQVLRRSDSHLEMLCRYCQLLLDMGLRNPVLSKAVEICLTIALNFLDFFMFIC